MINQDLSRDLNPLLYKKGKHHHIQSMDARRKLLRGKDLVVLHANKLTQQNNKHLNNASEAA